MSNQLDCIDNIHTLEAVLEKSPACIRYIECGKDYRFQGCLDKKISELGIHCKRIKSIRSWRAWCESLQPLTESWLMSAIKSK